MEVKRFDIINHLIEKNSYTRYLEIGVQDGICFGNVVCDEKIGVDPAARVEVSHKMTSDEFFEQNKSLFDIIFIDGLHESEQVYKDIQNALSCLSVGGTIVCHDMNPQREEHQTPKPTALTWTGDCWKALIRLRAENSLLEVKTVDTDWGVAIIKRGKSKKFEAPKELTWRWFDENRYEALNLISTIEFYNL